MKTSDRLAAELRKIANISSYENAQKYEGFAKRAALGEFDDFGDKYDCPITQLHTELTEAGLSKFAKRVADGEFDATKEESDDWANSPDGQATLALVRGHAPHKGGLGDAPVEAQFVEQMKMIATSIDLLFNGPVPKEEKKVGFILMVAPFTDEDTPRLNYMSNVSRADVVKLLEEQLKYFKAQDLGHETNPSRPQGTA